MHFRHFSAKIQLINL